MILFSFSYFVHLRRAGADDKPLRMVKTVLHELVKLRGAAIKGHLSMVPIDMKPQPIILAYIDLNLEVKLRMQMHFVSRFIGLFEFFADLIVVIHGWHPYIAMNSPIYYF